MRDKGMRKSGVVGGSWVIGWGSDEGTGGLFLIPHAFRPYHPVLAPHSSSLLPPYTPEGMR